MSTNRSLSLLVITSAFLSAQATNAQNSLFIAKNLVVDNTSDSQLLSIDSSPQFVKIESAQLDFDRAAEISSEPSRTELDRSSSATVPKVMAITAQTNVFSSDVATMLQGGRSIDRISATPSPSSWETSVEIPVPPPRTQLIRSIKNDRGIVQPSVNSPKIVKIYARPNPIVMPIAQSTITPTDATTATTPAVPASPAPIDNSAAPESRTEFIYPLMNPARISSRFGWRTHPLTGNRRFHSGLDIAAPSGAPVVAAGSGTVISAGWNGGYGKAIIIQHSDTQQTIYGHLSEVSVQPGQTIAAGTVIGLVGSTGNSTGPHLHFESRMPTNGVWTAVDPTQEIQYAVDNLRRSMPYARKNLPPGL